MQVAQELPTPTNSAMKHLKIPIPVQVQTESRSPLDYHKTNQVHATKTLEVVSRTLQLLQEEVDNTIVPTRRNQM